MLPHCFSAGSERVRLEGKEPRMDTDEHGWDFLIIVLSLFVFICVNPWLKWVNVGLIAWGFSLDSGH